MINRIFVCGDIHGSAENIRLILAQIDNPTEKDIIIICGDAGFEYETHIQFSAKTAAAKFPGSWIVLRGNHDSRYWKEHCNIPRGEQENINNWKPRYGWAFDENLFLYEKKYPNIKYECDCGSLRTIGDYNFLFVPGAYSVDKYYRLETHRPWNPNEQLTYKEQHKLLDIVIEANEKQIPIDFVIGHTFPLHRKPYYQQLFLIGLDQSSVDDNMEKFLDILSTEFEKNPSFKQYFGGHFHGDLVMGNKYTMLYRLVENIEDYI